MLKSCFSVNFNTALSITFANYYTQNSLHLQFRTDIIEIRWHVAYYYIKWRINCDAIVKTKASFFDVAVENFHRILIVHL